MESKRPNPLERFREKILSLVDEGMRPVLMHKRMKPAFDVILREALLLGKSGTERVNRVAEGANREALACLKAKENLADDPKLSKAHDVMMKAWVHLHEACLYAEEGE